MTQPRAKRSRRGKPPEGHWTKMIRPVMETPAWRALPTSAQALYPWLKLEWHGPQANNNGRITLSVRQAARALGVTPETAARALHALQAKGFIVVTQGGRLGCEGMAKAPQYELTEIELPHSESRGGRRLYLQWRRGKDFPVHRTPSNNPSGHNGKNRTPS